MYAYKLKIAYEGTAYSGWQVQPNAISIQETIVDVLKQILRVPHVTLIGAGRTDAGVHALEQVAHFRYEQPLDTYRLLLSINGLLPKDIRIKTFEQVPLDFHAQHSAKNKEYHYYLHLDRVMDPFRRAFCWHVSPRVNVDLLIEASQYFVGKHDFTTFANQAYAGSASRNAVRTIHRLDVCPIEGGLRLEFEGDGFLYKMVRNIVGTIIDVAAGKQKIEQIPIMMAAKDRRLAGRAAPPQGLFLVRVDY